MIPSKIYRFYRFGQIGKKSVNRVIFSKYILNDVGNKNIVLKPVFADLPDFEIG